MTNTTEDRFCDDDARWHAVVARDPEADGAFVYSVRTTGVFCRPSCPARRAKRANVRFHATAAAARQAGFRPCKRCRPETVSPGAGEQDAVARACRMLEEADNFPNLTDLAASAGLSRFHFHRLFKKHTGCTPKAYSVAIRARRVRDGLQQNPSVTRTIYEAGYHSNGHFYAGAKEQLGMTPTAYRAGGAGATMQFAVGTCALGAILVAATDKGVCALFLGDDPAVLTGELRQRFAKATIVPGDAAFAARLAEVIARVENPALGFNLPLDIRGTAFQMRVWAALRQIPAGTTATYREIAAQIGQPQATRAVAGACAANHIAVAIPCHRVIRTDDSLSGYRWGVERKAELLKRERESI